MSSKFGKAGKRNNRRKNLKEGESSKDSPKTQPRISFVPRRGQQRPLVSMPPGVHRQSEWIPIFTISATGVIESAFIKHEYFRPVSAADASRLYGARSLIEDIKTTKERQEKGESKYEILKKLTILLSGAGMVPTPADAGEKIAIFSRKLSATGHNSQIGKDVAEVQVLMNNLKANLASADLASAKGPGIKVFRAWISAKANIVVKCAERYLCARLLGDNTESLKQLTHEEFVPSWYHRTFVQSRMPAPDGLANVLQFLGKKPLRSMIRSSLEELIVEEYWNSDIVGFSNPIKTHVIHLTEEMRHPGYSKPEVWKSIQKLEIPLFPVGLTLKDNAKALFSTYRLESPKAYTDAAPVISFINASVNTLLGTNLSLRYSGHLALRSVISMADDQPWGDPAAPDTPGLAAQIKKIGFENLIDQRGSIFARAFPPATLVRNLLRSNHWNSFLTRSTKGQFTNTLLSANLSAADFPSALVKTLPRTMNPGKIPEIDKGPIVVPQCWAFGFTDPPAEYASKDGVLNIHWDKSHMAEIFKNTLAKDKKKTRERFAQSNLGMEANRILTQSRAGLTTAMQKNLTDYLCQFEHESIQLIALKTVLGGLRQTGQIKAMQHDWNAVPIDDPHSDRWADEQTDFE